MRQLALESLAACLFPHFLLSWAFQTAEKVPSAKPSRHNWDGIFATLMIFTRHKTLPKWGAESR